MLSQHACFYPHLSIGKTRNLIRTNITTVSNRQILPSFDVGATVVVDCIGIVDFSQSANAL